MKKMEYVEFCEAIFKELREGKKWNLKDDKMEFFVEGCRGKGANEDRFIRRVNCQYYNSTSDVLQGDWLVVYKKSGAGVNTHEFPMKILYALYSHMEDMALVWLQFEASLNNWDRDNLNITSGLWDYEKKKENLGVRIYPCNKHELDGCVGFQHGDIAVLAVLCDYLEDETIVREKVLQEHIAFWFKQEFDVVWDAFQRMGWMDAPKICIEQENETKELTCDTIRESVNLDHPIVLTCESREQGAVALYYPEIQMLVSNIVDGDYFVIMPTVSKVLVYPESCVTKAQVQKKLQALLLETPEEQILSKQVRYYNAKKDSLEIL